MGPFLLLKRIIKYELHPRAGLRSRFLLAHSAASLASVFVSNYFVYSRKADENIDESGYDGFLTAENTAYVPSGKPQNKPVQAAYDKQSKCYKMHI